MRKVTEARLHQAFFAVGTGNLKTILSSIEYRGMEIYKTTNAEGGDGIEVFYKGVNFWVPAANIVGLVYAKEETKAATAIKVFTKSA